MNILFLDSYYENVIEHLMGRPDAPPPDADPWTKTKWLNQQCHGTADYWERVVKALGHEAWTIVENAPWIKNGGAVDFPKPPDVVVCQNVADRRFLQNSPGTLDGRSAVKKVAFCSYRASDDDLRGWDAVFTSFPHQVERIRSLGSPCYYLQLAFDPVAAERTLARRQKIASPVGEYPQPIFRDLWLTFVGGVGYEHIWKQGTYDIGNVSSVFREHFKWWGYGPCAKSTLRETYQGRAWGTDYFEILLRSKITINRHGEIAGDYANNMRLYEATGCGACLVTNFAKNMPRIFRPMDECVTYRDTVDLSRQLWILYHDDGYRKEVAAAGQKRCLAEHTYAHRAKEFLDVLEKL